METRGAGINQQYTLSDEQQDGMRPDGLDWVSCCYYSLPQRLSSLLRPEDPCCLSLLLVSLLAACCLLRLLLVTVTADVAVGGPSSTPTTPAQPQLPRNPTTLPSFLAQAAQRAIQLSRHVILRLGCAWLARHPSSVTVHRHLAHCGKRRARLACRGLEAAASRARQSC